MLSKSKRFDELFFALWKKYCSSNLILRCYLGILLNLNILNIFFHGTASSWKIDIGFVYLSALSTFEYRLRFCHRTLLSITFMADRDVFFNAIPDIGAAMPLLGNILEVSILFPFIKKWEQVCSCKHSISWIHTFASCVIFYAWRSNTLLYYKSNRGLFFFFFF